MTTQVETSHGCSFGQLMRTVTNMRENFPITRRCECPSLGKVSELVREGRNLAFCARASMGLTYDRDPTMMCDLSGRLFNVPPTTLGDRG